jgi:hypothetical protein
MKRIKLLVLRCLMYSFTHETKRSHLFILKKMFAPSLRIPINRFVSPDSSQVIVKFMFGRRYLKLDEDSF